MLEFKPVRRTRLRYVCLRGRDVGIITKVIEEVGPRLRRMPVRGDLHPVSCFSYGSHARDPTGGCTDLLVDELIVRMNEEVSGTVDLYEKLHGVMQLACDEVASDGH